jgi:branched-chain amino acid transport system substrate-binding protein
MNDIKSTDSTRVVEHLEKGAKFDILKTREGYYRDWDHQLMQQMYTLTFKPEAQVTLSEAVPAADQSLEVLAPTRTENNCTMPA